jgi:hypothetical protein
MLYDSWLTDYDGWLDSQPVIEYEVKHDADEDVYYIVEESGRVYPNETFAREQDAEDFIKWLQGE